MIENGKLSKRDQKHNKILQKELHDLHRDVQAMNRRGADRNNNSSDSDNEFVDKKGKKWWGRFDQRHFSAVYPQEYFQIRDITTSNRILQISPKQSLSLSTYAQQRISNDYDLFSDASLIHILYRSNQPPLYALTSYQLQQAIPNYSETKKDRDAEIPFRITPISPKNEIADVQLKEVKLSLIGINEDHDFCKMVEDYKRTLQLFPSRNQVERDLLLWQEDLTTINIQNNKGWDKLIRSIKQEVKGAPINEGEVSKIKQYLMWVTVLKYFEHGHADKTLEMLMILIQNEKMMKPAKSIDVLNKKPFETDCKICFCSFNNDSNQVLYCDSCNTSFHLACYGLQQIPKEQIYYCDCCKFMKKYNYKRVTCQLCNKPNFPVKQLDGHFYHVTCLVLLNLVRIRSGLLTLREEMTHQKITEMVVNNEISQRECQFCPKTAGSEMGYRLRCSYQNCTNSAHPICAYIHGCKYHIKRDKVNQKLQVGYTCNAHDENRDWIEQTYIRRYMCNLKGTSSKTLQEFRRDYEQELQKKRENRVVVCKWDFSKITTKTKFIKRQFQKQQSKNQQNSEKVETQSGRMLQKFYKKGK